MSARKSAILDALDAFVRQRAGLEFGNYGDWSAYRAERRAITKDLHHYRELARAVRYCDGITADTLLEASRTAYSGRLTIECKPLRARTPSDNPTAAMPWRVRVDYCTGQYFPTEYRKAACAVLAAALWSHARDTMPAPDSWRVQSWGHWSGTRFVYDREPRTTSRADALAMLEAKGGEKYGNVQELHGGKTPGDWLRAHFRSEFGRAIQSRWFN